MSEKYEHREYGRRIKELREDLGLNGVQLLESLSSESGHIIANSTLSQHEKGKTRAGPDLVVALAKALRTTTDYLLLATDDPSPPRNSESYVILEPQSEESRRAMEDIAHLLEDMDTHDLHFTLDVLRRIFYARTEGRVSRGANRTGEMNRILEAIREVGKEIGEGDTVNKLIEALESRLPR